MFSPRIGQPNQKADMLEARQLRKSYGARAAVNDVSLSVGAGELLGLLGPNGAGKSTTVGMLAGLIAPDQGDVTINGERLDSHGAAFKRRIGLVPQDIALFEDLSAETNLRLFGSLYGMNAASLRQRSAEVLALVGLGDRARDKPMTFSGGMKRRLNIAAALMHDPDVLLLDEPTAGVDPQSRNAIFENLETLKARGKALIYTTHYMGEVERLADRVVIIDHGQVVASGTQAELFALLPTRGQLEIEITGNVDLTLISALDGVKTVERQGDKITVGIDDLTLSAPQVMAALARGGVTVKHLSSGRASLETVFLSLTGRQLRD
jgi:ABC-2 type transport system ATP-binding protein